MNRNRYIKIVSCALATGMVITGASLPVKAATPIAGATARLNASTQVEAVAKGYTALSGVNRYLADAMSKTKESAQTTVAQTDTSVPVVIPSETNTDAVTVSVSDITVETQTNSYEGIGIAQVDSCVNVRNAPSEEGEVIGKLYNNGAANIEGMEGDWYKVKSGNCDGYIKAEFLSVGDPEVERAASKYIATVHADLLYLRADTTTESSVLDMLEDGAKLEVLDDSTADIGWIKIKANEGEGYVSSDYVELSREFTYAESKEEEEARLAKEKAAAEAAVKAKNKSGGSGSGGITAPGGSNGAAVANFALQFVGNPYVYGGASLTNGADCSGFVMAVYSNFGVGLPHSSGADRGVGYGVDPSAMSPGDIVCYEGHVGIAIGGGQIVHASTPSSGIKISSAYYKPIVSVRRIF